MSEIFKCVEKLLNNNGVCVYVEGLQFSHPGDDMRCVRIEKEILTLDFSEHDKVFEDKIAKLENQIARLNEEKSFLRTRCMPYVEKDFDKRLYGKLAIVSCNEEFVDIQKYADGDDLYSREVRNLISEGGVKRLIGQYRNLSSRLDKMSAENNELKQRIAELESKETETCEKEPKVSDSAPSIEWYENRHQSDCIEINRLNTTIDVLIHKVEYLRQFAGLE